MPRRLSSDARRSQIVSTTLALLADTPVDRITTRQVARELGISQPALFRHFRSRDEILAAVVAHTREQLARLAAAALGRKAAAPLESLEALMRGLADYVARNPGMPRLLFHDVGSGEEAPYHKPLAQLVSMQRSIAAELVREAQRAGEVSGDVDPERAAALLVAALQGLLLQWQLSGRREPLEREVASMLVFWSAALKAGEPARSDTADAAGEGERAHPAPVLPLAALDVRPLLEAGGDPLGEILAQLRRLPPDGVMKLIAPFRPAPLLSLLAARGYRVEARELESDCWGVEVLAPSAPPIADLRELEAPEPLERILTATAKLAPGEAYAARVPRHPRLLLPRLEERGLRYQVYEEPDGTALVHVRRPS
jgi:AcrR family transcriptional regulator